MESVSLQTPEKSYTLEHAIADVDRLRTCQAHREVELLTQKLVRFAGAERNVFLSWEPTEDSGERFRFLIGCSPVWCQEYNANKWWMIDPCLRYARTNVDPIRASQLPLETAGQRQLMQAAAQYGFRAGMVVPAHGPRGARMGLLYLGSSGAPETVEPRVWACRGLMVNLAFALLAWHIELDRSDALARGPLDAIDLSLLSYAARDLDAAACAALLGIEEDEVARRFRTINRRLRVNSRKLAARRALELGIISA
jgi:hypothetical protein